jgi:Tol biopolymer transport system component
MGEVYLAEDTRLKRQVAIKILPPAVADDPSRRERFEREAQTVAALNHPNIVTVHSVEQSGPASFITLEFVDGRTLAEIIPKNGLPLKRLLTLATQIAEAVSAAHAASIVHRDLKPANVMVTAQDRVKVLDFGLAKLREAAVVEAGALPTRELTGEGKIVGTVAYMSPEQAEGHRVDERSDIFSLGVTLYEMATGERPFTGKTSASILSSILKDTPRSVTDVNPAMPRDLAVIVKRCLAKDQDRRYQSAKDLRNELEELQQSIDSGELTAPLPVSATRSRWLVPALSIAIAATVVIAAAVVVWRQRAAAAPAIREHVRLTQTAGVELYPSVSPDGQWVVYSGSATGNPDIYLQSVTGHAAINLTKDYEGADTMPAFSPDGQQIAFRSERDGGGIFVMGRTGESVKQVTQNGYYPAWFPGSERLVYSLDGPVGPENRTDTSELWVVNLDGSGAHRIGDQDGVQPRVSPHGKRIAYWGSSGNQPDTRNKPVVSTQPRHNRDVWTVDVDGHNPVRVTTHEANDWNPVWSADGSWLYFLSNRSGSMNLWRVAIDEATGIVHGELQPLTVPAQYIAHFSLSADGHTGVYASLINTSNVARVGFDAARGAVTGTLTSVTTGSQDFYFMDASPDGTRIAVTTSSRTREDLYVVSADGLTIRQLTNDFARDRAPRWLPDGRTIAFYSDRGGDFDVWEINANGSGLRPLPALQARILPVVSHDGFHMAVKDFLGRRLYVHDARDTSKAPEALPPFPDTTGNPEPDDWSPDDRQLAITSVGRLRSLWVYSFNRHAYSQVLKSIDGPATGSDVAKWLRDGTHLILSSGGRIWVTDLAGTMREVLSIPGETLMSPRLDVMNSQLFFLRQVADGDIWVVRF